MSDIEALVTCPYASNQQSVAPGVERPCEVYLSTSS